MDQSTQVNFPTVTFNATSTISTATNRKFRRNHTYANLYAPNNINNNNNHVSGKQRYCSNNTNNHTLNRRSQNFGSQSPIVNSTMNGTIPARSVFMRAEAFNAHVAYNHLETVPRVPATVSDFRDHQNGSGHASGPFSKLSCSASVISDGVHQGFKNDFSNYYPHQHNEYNMNSGMNKTSHCTCFHIDENEIPTPTPDGLSWRRLHMSRAKLKATATTSELLSGFAMVAMVELQINEDTRVPEWLFVLFAVCTTVLVAVHIFALMISTYILPNIDAISKLDVCELVRESPHERMRGFIELAWAFSTVLGLFLFLVEVAILCWVKFWDYSFTAAIAATVIVIPVLIVFILFAVHFHHSLVIQKCHTTKNDMEKLENMKRHLDEASTQA